jgi:hypothetical protein
MKVSNPSEVCNLALLKIKQSSISSLTEDSMQAKACNRVYEQSKSALLSEYNWSFAIARKVLTVVTDNSRLPNETDDDYNRRRDPTLFEYVRRFQLPESFLRLAAVYNSFNGPVYAVTGCKPPFTLEGGFLLSDLSIVKLKYVEDREDISKFSPQFIDCLILNIALRLTETFNDSGAYLQQLQSEYLLQLDKAKSSDCQQTMLPGILSYPMLAESGSF